MVASCLEKLLWTLLFIQLSPGCLLSRADARVVGITRNTDRLRGKSVVLRDNSSPLSLGGEAQDRLDRIEKELQDVAKRREALEREKSLLLQELGSSHLGTGQVLLKREEESLALASSGEERDSYSSRGSTGDGCHQENAMSAAKCDRAARLTTRSPPALPRVFVYELPGHFNRDLARRYRRCATDQYGTEVFFHEAFLVSDVRTRQPQEADFFFVPIYGECFLWSHEMLRRESRQVSFDATNEFYLEALDILVHEYPFWNRTGGRDHIFSFPGARGPTIFNSWRKTIRNSIFLTPEGDRTVSYFNTWKDIVVPGMEADPMFYLPSSRANIISGPRQFLAYFRGTIDHSDGPSYSKGLRPRLRQILQNETDVIYGVKAKNCDRSCYWEEMARSVFCLCPLGWTPWTLRFYQAVMVRCIPVVIADNIEFPFESRIDFTKFALKIPENKVDDLVHVLRSMPEEEREAKRRAMDEVWLAFTYQRPPQPGDAFHSTLEELAYKKRAFKTSSRHWWR